MKKFFTLCLLSLLFLSCTNINWDYLYLDKAEFVDLDHIRVETLGFWDSLTLENMRIRTDVPHPKIYYIDCIKVVDETFSERHKFILTLTRSLTPGDKIIVYGNSDYFVGTCRFTVPLE